MEKDKLEGMLIDFIDNRLSTEEMQQVRHLIDSDEEVRTLYHQLKEVMEVIDRSNDLVPTSRQYRRFQEFLQEEQREVKGKQVFISPLVWRAAAAVIFVAGGIALGYWFRPAVEDPQIGQLREEIRLAKVEMLAKIENQNSASQRMLGVNVAMTLHQPDDEIVNVLVKTLNEDKNTNVRLAALEALSKFDQEPRVRKELISSLAKQTDPVVQIALIQLMVKLKEKGVIQDLQKIIEDNKAIKPVKDEAYSGIVKLS